MLSQLTGPLTEIAVSILGVLVAAVLVAIRNFIAQKAGAAAADQAVNLLHRALDTGVNAAITAKPDATPETVVADAITHAKASIPGTIAKLAPPPEVLANIALSKLGLARAFQPIPPK